MLILKNIEICVGVFLILTGFFAPFFIGVTYVAQLWSNGEVVIQFVYVVPLIEYGLKDLFAVTLWLGYMILPFVAGIMLLLEGLK